MSAPRRLTGILVGAVLAVASAGAVAYAAPALRSVMFVGNNWEGTVDVIADRGDFAKIGRINTVPDKDQRLQEIYLNPIKLAFFMGIRNGVGEGHDQLVDDMYTTPDGTALVASRPSFA